MIRVPLKVDKLKKDVQYEQLGHDTCQLYSLDSIFRTLVFIETSKVLANGPSR